MATAAIVFIALGLVTILPATIYNLIKPTEWRVRLVTVFGCCFMLLHNWITADTFMMVFWILLGLLQAGLVLSYYKDEQRAQTS